MTICPEGDELFHADGRTDRQKDEHDVTYSRIPQFRPRTYAW